MVFALTRSGLHRLKVIIRHVVQDPRPVRVAVFPRHRIGVELSGNSCVAEKTGRERNLQGVPIFRLSYIQYVSSIRSARYLDYESAHQR